MWSLWWGGSGMGVGILTFLKKKNNNKFLIPGTTYLVKSIKIPRPQASKGQLYTSKSSKCSHPGGIVCKQNPYSRNSLAIKFLWVAWSPLGLSIDRYINILYCCSEFKALYMMGINIFLYVEEGIEQLCKNFFFFNLFSISFFNIFSSCWVEELG